MQAFAGMVVAAVNIIIDADVVSVVTHAIQTPPWPFALWNQGVYVDGAFGIGT